MRSAPALVTRDRLFELRRTRNHAVIVLVSVADRRIVPSLRLVSRLGYSDTRALHVSVDPEETRKLVDDWTRLGLSWLPLHVLGTAGRPLPASIRAGVREEVARIGSATVVLPELDCPKWWHRLVHRHNARRIAAELQGLQDVTTVIVPFYLPTLPPAWPS